MKLVLNSKSRCTIELDGKSVELSATELSEIRECLADSGRSLKATLSGELFRRLFETGILTPGELSNTFESAYWKSALPSLTISPYLRLRLSLSAGSKGMSNIEPPIAMFLQPDFVGSAAQLSNEIRDGLAGAAKTCAVRGTLFPRKRALTLAHEIAWNWLDGRKELSRWIEWGRDLKQSLHLSVLDYASLSNSSPTYTQAAITVSLNRQPHAPSQQVALPLKALCQIARAMDSLRGETEQTWDESELDSIYVRRLLGAIEGVGGFINRQEAPTIFEAREGSDIALTVTHMGHASLIVDGGGRRILIDPWLFVWDDGFEKQPLASRQLGRVDAIFFTHHHQDHLNVDSLLTLPHDVPVFVPCELGTPLEPRTADFLYHMGFQDVRRLAHGESYVVGDGLSVEAVPFFGEGQNRLGFGANCYLASRHGRNLLLHADASPDSEGQSLINTGMLRDIVARHGPIQVVFGTWWQERKFLCELSPLAIFYPGISPNDWLNDTEMCDCSPEFLCDLIQTTGATHMIFYAESGKECFLPKQKMSAYVPTISFLWNPLEYIREIITKATQAKVTEAQPYLKVIVPERGDPYIDRSEVGATRKMKRT